ncbi:MAG: nicotinamide riboside transporter PnuC [Chitinophagales bacterium]|nr:nicotinamide mononucleotide transporter [Bacteroidota bacterium]
MTELLHTFWQQLLQTSLLEAVAAICGILSVWFAIKEKIWVYPVGIVSVLLYVWICYQYKLYADMGVNAYYFLVSVWGWYEWANLPEKPALVIEKSDKKAILFYIIVSVFIAAFLYFILSNFTDSDVPLFDACTTALFLVAMYLMAIKKIAHWYWWILGDLLSIPLYLYKGLIFTAFQYVVFTFLAINGLLQWQQKWRISQQNKVL